MAKMTTWRRSILFPTWFLRGLITVTLVGLSAYFVAGLKSWNGYSRYYLLLALSLISLVLDIAEIIFYFLGRLNPAWVLSSSCIKTAIWLLYSIAAIISLAMTYNSLNGPGWSAISLVLTGTLLITCVICLVHAAILVHRTRQAKRLGHYHEIHGPATDYLAMRNNLIKESHHSRQNSVEPPHLGSHEVA